MLLVSVKLINAQCASGVPTFNIDFTGNPGGNWTSPNITTSDTCCGNSGDCVQFIVTLDSASTGLEFGFKGNGLNAGETFQIGCGPALPMGEPVCLTGVGPHFINYCSTNTIHNTKFKIEAIEEEDEPLDDFYLNPGCDFKVHWHGKSVV